VGGKRKRGGRGCNEKERRIEKSGLLN